MEREQEFFHGGVVSEEPGEKAGGIGIRDHGADFGFGETAKGFPAQECLIEHGFFPQRIKTVDALPSGDAGDPRFDGPPDESAIGVPCLAGDGALEELAVAVHRGIALGVHAGEKDFRFGREQLGLGRLPGSRFLARGGGGGGRCDRTSAGGHLFRKNIGNRTDRRGSGGCILRHLRSGRGDFLRLRFAWLRSKVDEYPNDCDAANDRRPSRGGMVVAVL